MPRIVMPPALLFFDKITLVIQGVLWFHTDFRTVFSSSVKNAVGVLIGIVLNAFIALGNIDILTIIYEHGMSFHFLMSSSISFISVL